MVRSIHHEELEAIRTRALALHTRLLAEARADHEREQGRVLSPGELLQAVAFGPDFEWLRPLTRLIVELDIALEHDTVTEADVATARAQVDGLASGADGSPPA
jgi:hypothetical protein